MTGNRTIILALFVVAALASLIAGGGPVAAQAQVIATIPLHGDPQGVAVNPATNRIYAAVGDADSISVIDGATNTVVAEIPGDGHPLKVAVNSNTNRVYVTNTTAGDLQVIDGATDTLVTTVPVGGAGIDVAVNPNTNRIYVTTYNTDEVQVIDGSTNAVITSIAVGDNPRDIAVGPANNRIYVSCDGSNNISVIDGETNTVVGSLSASGGLALNPITNRLYVAQEEGPDDSVWVFDGTTNTLLYTVPLGHSLSWQAVSAAVNPSTNRVYVATMFSPVDIIDAGGVVVGSVPVGYAYDIASNPATNRIYVANYSSQSVLVIEDVPHNVITVNSTGDTDTRDGALTLREALLLATGGLAVGDLDSGECAQVSNGSYGPPCASTDNFGAGSADTVIFDAVVFPRMAPATITLGSILPTISGANDTVRGAGGNVIVDGVSKAFDCFLISGEDSDNNTVRGLQMSGCSTGIRIQNGADNNTVSGLQMSGCSTAVRIEGGADNNIVGGSTADQRNVLSGNTTAVLISGAGTNGNTVIGNYIGVDAAGSSAVANESGVVVGDGAQNNVIGGSAEGQRNLISGNSVRGVGIFGVDTSGNVVKGNYIGTNPEGSSPIPNLAGVEIWDGAHNNTVGDADPADGNVIAFNANHGVSGGDGVANTIRGNSIHSNGGAGISYGMLAPPVIDAVNPASGHTEPECYSCTIEVFSDYADEGRVYHGSTTTDPTTGDWSYLGLLAGPYVTATITDAAGTTSEFSLPVVPHFGSYYLTDTTPGASSNSNVGFSISAPDYKYEDASMTILQPVDGLTANGLEAPIGAVAGTLNAEFGVGLLGGPCNTTPPPFPTLYNLYNASVDISVEDPAANMGWILQPDTALIPDADSDGLPDYLEKYPYFLNVLFDPDGSGPLLPLQPRARLAGHTTVANQWMLAQVLLFNPGQMTQLGGIYAQMGAEKGAPALIVLNDPSGEGETRPGAISDFCTPLSIATTLYGVTQDNPATGVNEADYTRQANPAASTGILGTGTHVAWNYSQSERNADGDAFENDFDACPYTADPADWNPRVTTCVPGSQPGDQDCDMLPSSCDPNDNEANSDQDADGYDNAQDNCPLVPNGCQDAPCGPMWNPLWDNQADRDAGLANADLGPRSDAIGDACDDSDDDGNEDSAGPGTCNDGIDNGPDGTTDGADADCTASMDSVDWPTSATNQQGTYWHGLPWDAECVGGVDADGDGYCEALETALGSSDANGPETGAECDDAVDGADGDGVINDGCPFVHPTAEFGAQCLNATDDDADTVVNDGCPIIGTPESLVIDATITAAAALPAATAAQSCSDGIDNDGDGSVDTDDTALGCNPAGYANDTDFDGIPDGSDNCPGVWNPTQTNTDNGFTARPPIFPAGDALGDACDADDDADGTADTIENYLPTDPLDRCRNGAIGTRSDAWPLDQNLDGAVTVPGDVLKYSGKMNAQVGASPPASWTLSRLDLNGDGVITVPGDVLKYFNQIAYVCFLP